MLTCPTCVMFHFWCVFWKLLSCIKHSEIDKVDILIFSVGAVHINYHSRDATAFVTLEKEMDFKNDILTMIMDINCSMVEIATKIVRTFLR